MKRRTLLAAAATAAFAPKVLAETPDWKATLFVDEGVDKQFLLGLQVLLAPGWKTYWRVPGEAGIPPQITVEGKDVESFLVEYPTPERIIDASGEAIGYHDEVIFIIRPTVTEAIQRNKLDVKVAAFFGVCKDICRPAKFEATIDQALPNPDLPKWAAKVPQFVQMASDAMQEGDVLHLSLRQPLDDIFVEGPEGLYFRKPLFDKLDARLKIDGLTDKQSLSGKVLKLTGKIAGMALEQDIEVS